MSIVLLTKNGMCYPLDAVTLSQMMHQRCSVHITALLLDDLTTAIVIHW